MLPCVGAAFHRRPPLTAGVDRRPVTMNQLVWTSGRNTRQKGGGGNKRVQTHEKGTHLDTGETQEGIRPSGPLTTTGSKETKEARMMVRREERLEKERRGPGEQVGRR